MLYSIEEIANRIFPIAKQYHLKAVYLFGSYARGTATADSDIDLMVDTEGTGIKSLLQLSALYCDLETALNKKIDLITVHSLSQSPQINSDISFRKRVLQERVSLYAAA